MKLFCDSRCRLGFRFFLLFLLNFHKAACQDKGEASAPKSKLTSYIIGKEAPKGRFPYVCSLSAREDGFHRCGGTLIRRQWVVTAAHCVDPDCPFSLGRNPLVRCGIHDLDTNEPDKVFSGEESHWPESWTGDVNDGYDIAVVRLNREANLTLPSIDSQGGKFPAGKTFTALGWGLNESGKHPDSLQMADNLLYLKHRECEEFLEDAVDNHSICAGLLRENTCKGDSGGPLLIPNRFRGSIAAGCPELDLLVGVTSMGSDECSDTKLPSVYTSIGAFWDWIQEKIGEDDVPDPSEVINGPSPDEEDDVRFLEAEEPEDEKREEAKLEQQEIEKERKRLSELSKKKLLKEAYRCITDDNALKLEAAFLENLNPESVYKSMVKMPWRRGWERLSLLHWSAYYDAPKCTEVVCFSESTLDYRVLLEYGALVDKLNSDRETPLHLAAGKGHAKVAKILLEHGADVNETQVNGWTALHFAARSSGAETIEILLEHGADVNKAEDNEYGWTALHFAARYADADIVEILLEHGADVNKAQAEHERPLHLAALGGNSEVVKLLIKEDAYLNSEDAYGDTPLHNAAMVGESQAAKVLVDAGALKTITNNNGKTPFDVICTLSSNPCPKSTQTVLEKLLRP